MHILQAIKMAFKSLWTSKLRSFLTMLGIIIGVVTVSLLTTVAQGVSDAVVSSIREQSTLTIVMGTSKNFTYGTVEEVLKRNQPKINGEVDGEVDVDAKDYYDYTMIIQTKSIIASEDITGLGSEDMSQYIKKEELPTAAELEKYRGTVFEPYIQMFAPLKNPEPLYSTVGLIDENFFKVCKAKFVGEFTKNPDDIMVDREFIDTYLGANLTNEEVVGKKLSVGVESYFTIDVNFKEFVAGEVKDAVCDAISQGIPSISIIKNGDETLYTDGDGNSIKIKINFYKYMLIDKMKNEIKTKLEAVPEISPYLAEEDSVLVEETLNAENIKVFTITGVVYEDAASETTSSSSGSSDSTALQMTGSSKKGTVYVYFDQVNFDCLNLKYESIEKIPISYAYLRYKTEDVMSTSTGNIMVDFITNGKLIFGTDFLLVSFSAVANIITKVLDVLTIMLTVISVISLIVGGIGIMNIMLVAVSERTREIGIRKAIGAKKGSILTQFLVEALMLSLLGGAIGLLISWIGTIIIGNVMAITLAMPGWVIAMSLGFCTFIGLLFGMFPAIKASNMQPIDALRRD